MFADRSNLGTSFSDKSGWFKEEFLERAKGLMRWKYFDLKAGVVHSDSESLAMLKALRDKGGSGKKKAGADAADVTAPRLLRRKGKKRHHNMAKSSAKETPEELVRQLFCGMQLLLPTHMHS